MAITTCKVLEALLQHTGSVLLAKIGRARYSQYCIVNKSNNVATVLIGDLSQPDGWISLTLLVRTSAPAASKWRSRGPRQGGAGAPLRIPQALPRRPQPAARYASKTVLLDLTNGLSPGWCCTESVKLQC